MDRKTMYQYLEEIEAIGSTIEKESIMKEMLQTCNSAEPFLRLAFNDNVYGISEKSIYNSFAYTNVNAFESASDYLFARNSLNVIACANKVSNLLYFAEQCLTKSGDELLHFIYEFFESMEAIKAKWFCRALLHDLRMGANMKTVNSVFIDLGLDPIYKFELQLCDKIDVYDEDKVRKKITFPCVVENKYDGTRVEAEVYEGKCTLTSRRGNDKTHQFPEICRYLEQLFPNPTHVILDGEIIAGDFNELSTRMHRKEGNLNEVSKLRYVVFDDLMQENLNYQYRWDNLVSLFSNFTSDHIILAEHYDALNIDDLQYAFEQANERKEEGIIIKLCKAPYVRGSRKYWFKCKKAFTADLKIIGYELGTGKRANMVSSLIVNDKSGTIGGSVGSGINDEICAYLTKQANILGSPGALSTELLKFIGQIVEIQYNEITKDNSFRFPRFKCLRDDKTEADDLSKEGYKR